MAIFLESSSNQTIKLAASLYEKKGRDRSGLFVLENERFVNELLSDAAKGFRVSFFMASEGFAQKNALDAYEAAADTYIVKDALFRRISDVETPQGILAVCEQRHYAPEDCISGDSPLLLLLDEMQDPGNLGTLLRLADAAGANGVLLSAGSADVYNPKVLRAAAGSALHVPFATGCDFNDTIPALQQRGIAVYAAMPNVQALPYALDMQKPTAILIGNEARGLSDALADICDARITLPMPGYAESLNAAMAGGILLYEAVRQRTQNA